MASTQDGALTLEEALARGAQGHKYPGRAYVIALGSGFYMSSRARNLNVDTGLHDGGKAVAAFEKSGARAW